MSVLSLVLVYFGDVFFNGARSLDLVCEGGHDVYIELNHSLSANSKTLSNGARFSILPLKIDDWFDVDVSRIDEETVRLVLAEINGVNSSCIRFSLG